VAAINEYDQVLFSITKPFCNLTRVDTSSQFHIIFVVHCGFLDWLPPIFGKCSNFRGHLLLQRLVEDRARNRMAETLDLFEQVCSNGHLNCSSFILFLNKRDLFSEKLRRVDMRVLFNEYTGWSIVCWVDSNSILTVID
jgi:hypothetical protein